MHITSIEWMTTYCSRPRRNTVVVDVDVAVAGDDDKEEMNVEFNE